MNAPRRRRTLRLRTRVTIFFSLTALVASLGLAVVTFAVARSFLIDQREQTARTEAYAHAKTVRDQLLAERRVGGRQRRYVRRHVSRVDLADLAPHVIQQPIDGAFYRIGHCTFPPLYARMPGLPKDGDLDRNPRRVPLPRR